ncbi:hypothetical protein Asppvi_009329 [Aspergillus pseudoviridinutans]|uniref:Probable Xaa-Pro aminopeptidase P n=1 Tax=Aspergillus pseudoviridinutans TaxID=1517512 RepID=A0A9P3BJB6_9EURO|nr:uncharacterized protein Asppvi_009329 [Aspergillus pseudoviridinutans]GIJ90375.1 hypothetical protein Asppvi_009329 [Aspergillus pseudoviridinutans]
MREPPPCQLPPRVERLRALMTDQSIDAIVCLKPENTFYLSGFNPIIYSHPAIVVVTLDHDPILLVFALRGQHARASAWVTDIRLFGTWSDIETLAPDWKEALMIILTSLRASGKTIGLEEGFIPVAQSRNLAEILPQAKFVDVSPFIDQCRLVKDPDEIKNARIAARIADVGMDAAFTALARAGSTERDVAIASTNAMNQYWAENYGDDVEICGFGSLEGGQHNGLAAWVLSGPRKSYACDNPTTRVPEPGETVSVFVWTVANGMHAELERTVCVGPVAEVEQRAIMDILEIRAKVDARMRPGIPVSELYEIAKKGFEAKGYGSIIPGRIGHAIGLGPHENASISATSPVILEPGMILTLEPHILIPDVCGTQFSDTILITETGREYLTRFSRGYLTVN